jgi:hypothetical protein
MSLPVKRTDAGPPGTATGEKPETAKTQSGHQKAKGTPRPRDVPLQ